MEHIVRTLQALAEPSRLRLLQCLSQRKACVCELTEVLQLSQTQVSRHLSALKNAGLVKSERSGQRVVYWVVEPRAGSPAARVLEALEDWLRETPQVARDRKRCAKLLGKAQTACSGASGLG